MISVLILILTKHSSISINLISIPIPNIPHNQTQSFSPNSSPPSQKSSP